MRNEITLVSVKNKISCVCYITVKFARGLRSLKSIDGISKKWNYVIKTIYSNALSWKLTLKNWDLLKFNYACSTCKCNMTCILSSMVYQCKPLPQECNINLPTLENWELLKLNYACSICKCNMPCRLFSVVYQCKPLA